MSGNAGNQFDPSLLMKEINASNMGWAGDKPTKARAEKGTRQKKESKYNPEF